MVLNIISLNVRGIKDNVKRKAIFEYYRTRCDILCLQETHSTIEDEVTWKTSWGGNSIFAHGTNNSRGVCVLVNPKFQGKISNILCDQEGRYILCDIWHDDVLCTMANIYAPNSDSPGFFQQIFEKVVHRNDRNIVIGDFNTVLNPELDRKKYPGQDKGLTKSAQVINNHKVQHHMEDIWRIQNPDKIRYSWYRRKPKLQASRLDYAIISTGLCDAVHNCFYLNGVRTDHSAFFLGLEIKREDRGSGYWKMNTTYLADNDFLTKASAEISKIKTETEGVSDPREVWEIFKVKFRQFCQKFSKMRGMENNIAVSQLSEKVVEYENNIENLKEDELDLYYNTKGELDQLINKKTRGVMFRSKAKWQMESEKNSKYFYSLEKARFNAKTCHAIFNEHDELVKCQKDIMTAQQHFYQDLYTADKNVTFSLNNNVKQCVPDNSMAKSEDMFSMEEVGAAIKTLVNGSCPGPRRFSN